MVNPNLTVPAEPDLFLEFLLRCALTAPGASSSPTAGRILARLLVVGAIEGGDELVTPYLVPVPGEDASFEVRAYRPGNLDPTEVRAGLGAAAALRIALRAARDGDDGLEVVSQTRAGLERCVLVRDSTGDFEFRFASGETLNGEPEDCAAARRAWAVTLADWRAWVAGEHPEDELGRSRPEGIGLVSAESPPAPAAPAPAAPALSDRADSPPAGTPAPPVRARKVGEDDGLRDEARWQADPPIGVADISDREFDVLRGPPGPPGPQSSRGWWKPHAGDNGEEAGGAEDEAPDQGHAGPRDQGEGEGEPSMSPHGTDTSDRDRDRDRQADAGDEPPVALDLEPDTAPPPAGEADAPLPSSPHSVPPTIPAAVATGISPDAEAVIGAIHESLADLSIKADLSQELIRQALTADRDLVEPLARRLSIRLGESLGRPDVRDFIDAVLPLIPRPGEVAEAVTSDVTALLSEVLLRRRPGELSGGIEGLAIIGAVEQLQVQLDGMSDQLRRSTGVLQSIDERMEVSDRRTAAAERIGASIEQEMQRLAQRIDEQVEALAASAGGGSELADGVARLTRKLRQSVAQLDRALVRLDDVVEHPVVGPGRPLGVRARFNGEDT